jgi:hypothetical protein
VSEYEMIAELQKGISLAEMKALPDSELVRRFDLLVTSEHGDGFMGSQDYLDERDRRKTERATKWLIRLTVVLTVLTFVIAVFTVALAYAALTE